MRDPSAAGGSGEMSGQAGARAPFLSVVIPAYNEAERIGDSLRRASAWLAVPGRLDGAAEIVVVDDGSSDATTSIVEQEAARRTAPGPTVRLLRNVRNHGKGYSIKHGVLLAEGELVLLSDADFSTPIEELPLLLECMGREGCDIVIGSRGLDGSNIEVRQPFWREGMGRVFNRIVRSATGLPYRDTQCGFKLMRRQAVLPLFRGARIERFAYDVEILYLARKTGVEIRELPVLWRNARGSKVHPVRDALRMLYDVMRILWRDRRGLYGRLGEKA
jgi:dolichyl-phosphate beta-glucosyltransferase